MEFEYQNGRAWPEQVMVTESLRERWGAYLHAGHTWHRCTIIPEPDVMIYYRFHPDRVYAMPEEPNICYLKYWKYGLDGRSSAERFNIGSPTLIQDIGKILESLLK